MKRSFILFVLLLPLLSGCVQKKEPTGASFGSYQVFSPDLAKNGIAWEAYEPEHKSGEPLLAELLQQIRVPSDDGHVSMIGGTVALPEISIGTNGLVTLLFDEGYTEVSGVGEVLLRAAIVKTLCQCGEIDSVEIYVAGQPLLNSQNMPIGIMKADDFLDSLRMNTDVQEFSAIVYYANREGTGLIASSLVLSHSGSESEELAVLCRLIDGPVESGMYPVLPDTVKVHSVVTKEGVCTVDFNAEFLEKLPEVSEEVLVYSVVNSLVNLPDVQSVQFLIDGEMHKIFQKLDLSVSYERNLNIVENE